MIDKLKLDHGQIDQYRREGYLILDCAVPANHLALLQRVCQQLLDAGKAVVDDGDTKRDHKFLFECAKQKPELWDFVFSPLYAEIVGALVGPEAWFINDQYSYKDANTGGVFAWHQDGAYIGAPHRTYLTTWVALNDMNEANGTVRVVPRSRAKVHEVVRGAKNLMQGYADYIGDDPGIPVIVPAGGMALFDSTIFHTSTANDSPNPRAAYIVQFGPEAIVGRPGEGLSLQGIPFPRNEAQGD